ncbi:MAG: HAMP domain-containing histidine kinase [Treponema sp.]|nr:HAMP domain-containing histidine kinase [Treponema sp.]
MKIKTQLRIFLAGVVLVPVLAITALISYHYISRPERVLLDGYKQVRALSTLPFSRQDISIFKQLLRTLPPDVEFIILKNMENVLLTTMGEFKDTQTINKHEFFKYMEETSGEYFYQLVSPPLKDTESDILFISRTTREKKHRKDNLVIFIRIVFIFLGIFEIFCVIFIIALSHTISHSITLLSKKTEKIAKGELDTKLNYEKEGKAQNEITSLTENLDKMRLALKDNEERRTKFIMGISHDLRTPVAVIKGYTEAMSDGFYNDPEEMKKSLTIISSKTEQLETMVNTLINFVKLKATDWGQQLQKQNITPVFNEFAQSSVTTGGLFKRYVTANINLNENIEVAFDKMLVQRSLENLFSNALRYTNENDSITISASEEKDERGSRIIFKIRDTGIGIAKEDQEKIFDMFYRASSSRREEGMGIGLATVMTIIKAHGWKIRVESEPGKGAEFIIEIPLK